VCVRVRAVFMHVCVYLHIGVYRPSSRHAAIRLRNGLRERELETKKINNFYYIPKKKITISQWQQREVETEKKNIIVY
jgi:hypothetical protein